MDANAKIEADPALVAKTISYIRAQLAGMTGKTPAIIAAKTKLIVDTLGFFSPNTVEVICNDDPNVQSFCDAHIDDLARATLLNYLKFPPGRLPQGVSPLDILAIVRDYYNKSTKKADYDAVFRDGRYVELTGKRKRPVVASPDIPATPPPENGPMKWSEIVPKFSSPIGNLNGVGEGPAAGTARDRERAANCIKKEENMMDFKRTDLKKFSWNDLAKLKKRAPKIVDLMNKILEVNQKDQQDYGHGFKHYIFVNNKQEYGVKLVIAALMAHPSFHVRNTDARTLSAPHPGKNNVGFLVSSLYYGINYDTKKFRKEIMDAYNDRKDNVYGEKMNIIILDSGFKEGIDLLDVKYAHIFDELKNQSEMKQAVGRALRYCGQAGLPYPALRGWTLRVFTYKLKFANPVKGVSTAGELYWETIDDQAKKKRKIETFVEDMLSAVSII